MQKLHIEIPLILPDVPDEKDGCIQKLIDTLQDEQGIEKIHVAEKQDHGIPQLCFHYNPDIISIDRIVTLAKQTGAILSEKIGHKILEVEGIRHARHARSVENSIKEQRGLLEASVSPLGMIRLEFDNSLTSEGDLIALLRKEGLRIPDTAIAAEKYRSGLKEQEVEKEAHEHEGEHDHDHGGIFGKNTELIFSLTSGLLLGIGFGLSFVTKFPDWVSLLFYIGAYFFGGFYTAKEAIETVLKGGFEIDFLMLVAAIGAAILGKWAEGALLLSLFSAGHALEHYAMNKARKSIAALTGLAPKTALRKNNGNTEEVGIEALQPGDIIIIRPNTKIPADGVVVKGQGGVNQSPITGESMPADKIAVELLEMNYLEEQLIKDENRVFAGTINGNNVLEVKVIKKAEDSTLARMVKLVNEAQTQKSPTQLLTDKFERYFVPSVLGLVTLLNFAFLVVDEPFSASFYRAMAVLVAASPCALAIATPSAVLSGIARAARGGVLIKGGRPLEDLGELTALAFDKTGTLTEGKPQLTEVIPLGGLKEQELLQIVVAVERLSDHPLAKAIVRGAEKRFPNSPILNAENQEAVLGRGIKALLDGNEIHIGNLKLFETLDDSRPSSQTREKVKSLEDNGNTTMLIRRNKDYIGVIALMDTPRKEAKATIEKLRKIGLKRLVMLTGDNQKVADAVAKAIGLTDAWGGLLPEEKVEAIKKLKTQEKKVAMVGDGVNDAPAMANSTVGIAMGAAGSDVALETADIALMADNLENLPFAIGLSRKAKGIIKQNLWISLGIVAILIPLTMLGIANLGMAVFIHEGSTVLVVFNALRLLAFKNQ